MDARSDSPCLGPRSPSRNARDPFTITARITDPDGVPHDLAESDLGRPRQVPVPFARKEHLLGRAFLIYWPWQPSAAGFRPRLLP